MKLEQAARHALEAMDLAKGSHGVMLMSNPPHDAWIYRGCDSKLSEAITALREALAEQATVSGGVCGGCAKKAADGWALYCVECWEKAEQEPVAWLLVNEQGSERLEWEPVQDISKWKSTPLYTHPVRTKYLTDDEILEADNRSHGNTEWTKKKAFARAVITADREKNK